MPGVVSAYLSISRASNGGPPPPHSVWSRHRGTTAASDSDGPQSGEAASTTGANEDLRLLRAGQAGDSAALERLLMRHEPSLYQLCLGMLGHPSDAEDAVQETFLRGLRALTGPGRSGFRGDASVKTWIFRIGINVCLEWRRARRLALSLDDVSFDLPDSAPTPEVSALRRLRIRDAFRNLMPRQRALLLLKELEGWSVGEIAQAFGWNEKKVNNELYKTRRALAAWRERDAQESEGAE